jgi:hypothetical protein
MQASVECKGKSLESNGNALETAMMGDGSPIFPVVRGVVTKPAHIAKTEGNGVDNKEEETTNETHLGRDVAKDSTTENTPKIAVKQLPQIAEQYGRVHEEALKILHAQGLDSIVEHKRENPIAIKKQLSNSHSVLGVLSPFNITTYKLMETGTNYHNNGIIAFHIIAVVSLLTGSNTSRKCMGNVIEAWRKITKVIYTLCSGDEATIKLVMHKILRDHVDSANRTYHLLLQVSKSPGMCKVRAPAILAWVEKLEHDAREYFEILRKDMMIENMQEALALNSAVPMRRNTDNLQTIDEDDYDA